MLRRPKPPMPTREQRAFTHLALCFVKSTSCGDGWLRVSALNAEMAAVFASWALLQVKDSGKTDNWLFRPVDLFPPEQLEKLEEKRQEVSAVATELRGLVTDLRLVDEGQVSVLHRKHIDRLHRYNEAKDRGQALLGRLAQLNGQTTRDLYPQFDLSLDD